MQRIESVLETCHWLKEWKTNGKSTSATYGNFGWLQTELHLLPCFHHYLSITQHHVYVECMKSAPPNVKIFLDILRYKIKTKEIAIESNSCNTHQEKLLAICSFWNVSASQQTTWSSRTAVIRWCITCWCSTCCWLMNIVRRWHDLMK